MTFSNRATEYLRSLKRREAVSVSEVRSAFARSNVALPDAWLDFHHELGGYVEILGRDRATWGLMHVAPRWQEPMALWFEEDDAGVVIACADVHPSYDYWLTESGEFTGLGGGGPCESFGVKVEQDALLWSVAREGAWRRVLHFDDWPSEKKDEVKASVADDVVYEATDKFTKCYLSGACLMFERRGGNSVWMKAES